MRQRKKTTIQKTLRKQKTVSKREYVYNALLAIAKVDVLSKPIKWSIKGLKRRLSHGSSKSKRANLRKVLLQEQTHHHFHHTNAPKSPFIQQ